MATQNSHQIESIQYQRSISQSIAPSREASMSGLVHEERLKALGMCLESLRQLISPVDSASLPGLPKAEGAQDVSPGKC